MTAPPGRIAALPLVFAVTLSPVAPVLAIVAWLAVVDSATLDSVMRLAVLLLVIGCGLALATGVPLALWLLRDPAAPLWRWAAAGLGGGVLAGAAVAVWLFTSHARELTGIGDVVAVMALGVTCTVGLVSGLLAHTLLFRVFRVR